MKQNSIQTRKLGTIKILNILTNSMHHPNMHASLNWFEDISWFLDINFNVKGTVVPLVSLPSVKL